MPTVDGEVPIDEPANHCESPVREVDYPRAAMDGDKAERQQCVCTAGAQAQKPEANGVCHESGSAGRRPVEVGFAHWVLGEKESRTLRVNSGHECVRP